MAAPARRRPGRHRQTLSFAIVAINGGTRLAIGFAAVPGSKDEACGLASAGLA